MRIRQLQQLGGDGSVGVTLPKDELEYLGVLDEDGHPVRDDQQVILESEGGGKFSLQLCGVDELEAEPAD